MENNKQEPETFIQVGVFALRDEFGNFLPSRPLYIKVNENVKESGLTESEEQALHKISNLFAEKYGIKQNETATKKQ
ncbi:MAG: hypothetical protein ACI4TT_03350 [Christensenellales bacterium]